MSILETTLKQMETTFSSNTFIGKAFLLGLKNNKLNKRVVREYLIANCTQLSTTRMWSKEQLKTSVQLNDVNCIAYLQSRGFKVLKPVTEYKEIDSNKCTGFGKITGTFIPK